MVAIQSTIITAITILICAQTSEAAIGGIIKGIFGKRDSLIEMRGETPLFTRAGAEDFAGCLNAIKTHGKPHYDRHNPLSVTVSNLPAQCIIDANNFHKAGKKADGTITVVAHDALKLQATDPKKPVDAKLESTFGG